MDQPKFIVLQTKWIIGIVLLSLFHFDEGDASCEHMETQGYLFKRVPQKYIKTRDDSVLELQFAVKALSSVHIRVTAADNDDISATEAVFFISRFTYELNVDYQNHMSFEHVGLMGPVKKVAKQLLSSREFRPFWLRFNLTSGLLTFGNIGQSEPLISWADDYYRHRRVTASFKIASLRSTIMDAVWMFCDDWEFSEKADDMKAGLDCKSMTTTMKNSSDYFKAEDEMVSRSDRKWLSFAVGPSTAWDVEHVVHFMDSKKLPLFKVVIGKETVKFIRISEEHVHGRDCKPDDSAKGGGNDLHSARIILMEDKILLECANDTNAIDLSMHRNFADVSFVRFSSNSNMSVNWFHGCKGIEVQSPGTATTNIDEAIKQNLTQLYDSVFKTVPTANTSWSSPEEVVENVQRTCRVVQTFKPAYDQFFEMQEGGTINGSFSRLVFTVWGSNFRIKFSEEFPVTENFYEIFLGIANSTTISRSGDSAAAYVDTESLWKNNTVQQFVIEHDAATGDINIIHKHDTVLTWRDPKAFPVRFFSVASGITGKISNTTWIFGCDKRQLHCYHPVHGNQYLYSQYFWLSREGTVSSDKNTTMLEFWVRVRNSAHLRFEPSLPYSGHPPATVEFDFGVDNRINLDIMSRRVASQRVVNAVNEDNYTGYWIKQDLATGSLYLGNIGDNKVLLRYNAHRRLRPLMFFSGTNSQRAGNSTWVFGCVGAERPGADASAPGEDYSIETTESIESDYSYERIEDSSEHTSWKPTSTTARGQSPSSTTVPSFRNASALTRWLEGLGPPTANTSIDGRLRIRRMVMHDEKAEMVLYGSLNLVWRENITWPKTSSLPSKVNVSSKSPPGWILRDLFATVGELTVEISSRSHITRHSHGSADLFLNDVKVEPTCKTDVTAWPKDSTSCTFALALWARHEKLELRRVSVEIDSAAAETGWTKPLITEDNTTTKMRLGSRTAISRKVHLSMQRKGTDLYILCLTPLITILVLACGCFRTLIGSRSTTTLQERLILLGCALFILSGFAIWIHGKVPEYHKTPPTMLSAYLWSTAILVFFMALSTLIGSRISSGSPPPSWLVQLFSGKRISRILCLSNASIAANNQGVEFKSESDQVYLSTTAAADEEQCTSNESPTMGDKQISWFWSWQIVITGLDRVITCSCFVAFLTVLSTLV